MKLFPFKARHPLEVCYPLKDRHSLEACHPALDAGSIVESGFPLSRLCHNGGQIQEKVLRCRKVRGRNELSQRA